MQWTWWLASLLWLWRLLSYSGFRRALFLSVSVFFFGIRYVFLLRQYYFLIGTLTLHIITRQLVLYKYIFHSIFDFAALKKQKDNIFFYINRSTLIILRSSKVRRQTLSTVCSSHRVFAAVKSKTNRKKRSRAEIKAFNRNHKYHTLYSNAINVEWVWIVHLIFNRILFIAFHSFGCEKKKGFFCSFVCYFLKWSMVVEVLLSRHTGVWRERKETIHACTSARQ